MPLRSRRVSPRLRSAVVAKPPEVERLEPRLLLAALPSGFEHQQIVSGISFPTAMAFAPDGRIFVAEKTGAVRVVKDGNLLPRPFVTVNTLAVVEFGLVGLVLDPDFARNGHVYVNYTTTASPPRNVIQRFTAVGDVAASGSVRTIFQLGTLNPNATHHVGGAMHFGPDGKLYVSTGDNNRGQNSQELSNLHGKMLRINRDGSIPTDNPFYRTATGQNRAIWAFGLRNPFTFGIEPRSGRILINDVGGNRWEEINLGRPGANYGWPRVEGPASTFTPPLYAYSHASTAQGAAAITGGVFYSPSTPMFPARYEGKYFFADFNNHWIRVLDVSTGQAQTFATGIASRTLDLDVGPDGALYYLAGIQNGSINRIAYTGSLTPVISTQPESRRVGIDMEARFTVSASSSGGAVSYQWQRQGGDEEAFSDIPGARSASYRVPSAALIDDGVRYRVVVSNVHGTVISNVAVLTVVPLQPPSLTVLTPVAEATFQAGQRITFQATGSDILTGGLPPSAFRWTAEVVHGEGAGEVARPVTGGIGNTGSFRIPDDMPYKRTDLSVRLTVTALGSAGLSTTHLISLEPEIGTLSLATLPAGLPVAIDGEPLEAPGTVESIVGLRRLISAPAYQIMEGEFYRLAGWSDGGGASHVVTAGAAPLALTARYVVSPTFREDFSDPEAGHFNPVSGIWFVDGEAAYWASPEEQDGDALSLLPESTPLPPEWTASVTLVSDTEPGYYRNGFIIFDYVSPTNFKYAGLRVAAGQWVIGQRTAAGWEDRASLPATISHYREHAIRFGVSGTTVTIFVPAAGQLSHEFASPPFGGRIGLATERSQTSFDDFMVSLLPLPTPVAGSWSLESETAYRASPLVLEGDAVSLLPDSTELPPDWTASVTIQIDPVPGLYRNGFIIFDYVSETQFKYAGLRQAAGQWVIGERTAEGWEDRAAQPATIGPRRDQALRIDVAGTAVTLFGDGVAHVRHEFQSPPSGGQLGMGTERSRTTFDNFVVSDPPALAPAVGNWLAETASTYRASPAAWDGDAVSLLPESLPLPPEWTASVTINSAPVLGMYRNGFIIFDYVSPTNFKYAGLRVAAGQWVIGQRTAAGWEDRASLPATIGDRGIHDLRLGVAGNSVTLFADGASSVRHEFDGLTPGGRLGLATERGWTSFSGLVVSGWEPFSRSLS
jgi:glucose/arabinose dehydrogenase